MDNVGDDDGFGTYSSEDWVEFNLKEIPEDLDFCIRILNKDEATMSVSSKIY